MASASDCDLDVLAAAEVHTKFRADLFANLEDLLSGRHVELRHYLDHWLAQEKAAIVLLLEQQCRSPAELLPTKGEAKGQHGWKPSQLDASNDGFECLGILPEERDPIRPALGVHAVALDFNNSEMPETDSGSQMLTLDERQEINSGSGDHLIVLDVGKVQDAGSGNAKHVLELLHKRTLKKSATDETIPEEYGAATSSVHSPRGAIAEARETLSVARLSYACNGIEEGSRASGMEFPEPETPCAVYSHPKKDKSNVSFNFDADVSSGSDELGINAEESEPPARPKSRTNVRQMTKLSKTSEIMPVMSATFTEQDQTRRASALDRAHLKHSMGRKDSIAKVISMSTRVRSRAQRITESKYFEPFFALIIIINSLMLGIQLEYASHLRDDTMQEPVQFFIVQNIFASLFLTEVTLRMLAHGCQFFRDAWNYLDLFVVLSSIVEFVLDILTTSSMDEQNEGFESVGSIRLMRMLRVTRLARVIRVIKIVRFLTSLRTLITSIVCTLRSLFWAMFLLVMIIYLFAMVLAQMSNQVLEKGRGSEPLMDYWGSLSTSMFTLFKVVSQGVSWEECVRPLEEVHAICVILFTVFIIFTYFAVLNVVTGVFCQSAIAAAERDYDLVVQSNLADKTHYLNKLRQLFFDIDDDQNGEIDIKEFERHLMDEKVQAYLTSLELNSSDIWRLFKLLDANESTFIDLEEFLTGCFRLRGPAKAIEMAELMYESRHTRKKLFRFMTKVEFSLRTILEEIGLGSSPLLGEPENGFNFWNNPVRAQGTSDSRWSRETGVASNGSKREDVASRRTDHSDNYSFSVGEYESSSAGYEMTSQDKDHEPRALQLVTRL